MLLAIAATAGVATRAAAPVELSALLAEAEASHPVLLAAAARVSAAEQLPAQAEARPDPLASLSYTNESLTDFTLGSSPDSNLTLSWMQEVPYPGKRRLAGDVARAEADVERRKVDTARLQIRAGIKMLYADLWRIDRTAEVLTDSLRLVDAFVDTARVRYESGEGNLESILKAQTERAALDVEIAALARARDGAEAALNAAVGRAEPSPLGPALSLPPTVAADGSTLERAALERSPEILELHAASRRNEARIALARKNLNPDLVWGAAYANRGGLEPMVSGLFGVRVPLSRRTRQAAAAQTELESEAGSRDVEAGAARIRSQVRALVARAAEAHTRTVLYRDAVLPLARSSLEAATAAFSAGRVEFLTLLDDFRTVLNLEREHADHAASEVQALAALEPLTATILVLAGGPGEPGHPGGGTDE